MSDLAALIERLEKATEPDREIDELLAEVAGYKRASFTVAYGNAWDDSDGNFIGPRFTGSIDAAVTLIPKAAKPFWKVGVDVDGVAFAQCGMSTVS